jgi:hypothetical protein
MDALVRLQEASMGLLGRVDRVLALHGAPEQHAIWPLLRRGGLLPGDAVAAAAGWSPESLQQPIALLHKHRERLVEVEHLLRPPSGWQGPAAEGATARVEALQRSHEVLARNAEVLEAGLGELTEWFGEARARLGRSLARVMSSAQAVTVTIGDESPLLTAQAAADMGAELLGEVERFWVGAQELVRDWPDRFDEPVVHAPAAGAAGDGDLAVEL